MSSKTTDWRPGPSVCRCCLSEGCYKDISTEYFWMGKREVYAEMLLETLSLSISYSQSGGPNSNSRLICEACISRLRDASEFRRQVQECERTFMQYLDPGTSAAELEVEALPVESIDTQVKVERVKLEKEPSEGDFDDRGDLPDLDDDDDDDLDDQPLTRLASKIPKKESVDLFDLLDNANAKVGEKRKSSSKAKTPAAKKSKSKKEAKATSSKPKPEKKKKDETLMSIARSNAETILQYTTAFPFKLSEGSDLVCVYCCDKFPSASMFKDHMKSEHPEVNVRVAFAHVGQGFLKADCSKLLCRLCDLEFDGIHIIAEHLESEHNANLNLDHFLGIVPFKLQDDKFICVVCDEKATCLRALSRHTQSHFAYFACQSCGNSFATPSALQRHIRLTHSLSDLQCTSCGEQFAFLEDLKEHYLENKMCCKHLCRICGDRFYSWSSKQSHMETVHAVPAKEYKCCECGMAFESRDKMRIHFVIEHTEDYHQCWFCDEKFCTEPALKRHIVFHTREKNYRCDVCGKSFFRKSTLTLHKWIHSDVKKYQCAICNKQFNQKVVWTKHIERFHPDLLTEAE